MRGFLQLEREALRRVLGLPFALALALLGAEVGALAFATAYGRARGAFLHGDLLDLADAAPAVLLGLDLLFVLSSLSFGAAVSFITRPAGAAPSLLAAARSSGGAVSLTAIAGVVIYAMTLGYAQLLPVLMLQNASLAARAALVAAALTPALLVGWVLCAGALAGVVLVGRGVQPGRALASGLDHALRRPGAMLLWLVHASAAVALVSLSLLVPGVARLLVLAPLLSFAALWAVAAFDARLGADARLATG